MVEEQQKIIKEDTMDEPQEKNRTNWKFLFRIVSVILFIVMIIVLVIIKLANPDFELKWIILIIVLSLVIFGTAFFIFEILSIFGRYKRLEQDLEKLPKAITYEEARKIVERILLQPDRANKIKRIHDEGHEYHGKKRNQLIYFTYFDCVFQDYGEPISYFIAINLHFPDRKRILTNPSVPTMKMAVKSLAIDSEDLPDTEIIEERNLVTGGERKVTKTVNQPPKKQEPESSKGELR